ncbi:acyltransferase family protein, partial [Slackia exigua]
MKPFRLDIVSTYRAPLYGFAILWIVIYHATIDNVDFSFGIEQLLWFKGIMELGNAGVDIFLFLSGVCLFFSYAKKPTLHDFMKKRAVRLIVPLVVIDYGYWIIRCLVQDP